MLRRLNGFLVCSCILYLWPSCPSLRLTGKAIENSGAIVISAKPVGVVNSKGMSVAYRRLPSGEEVVEVLGISGSDKRLSVFTGSPEDGTLPPVMGKLTSDAEGLRFKPEFPFQPGLTYFVQCRGGNQSTGLFSFSLPEKVLEPVAGVAAVYPSKNELPENLLKFYIHFSHPMSVGNVYDYIHLLDESGEALELPFLELGEELWDYDNQRLTLLFDPGRIKTGLVPNLEEGMVLQRGKRYTLKIDAAWQDDEGRLLINGFEKTFSVVGPDTVSPNPYNWKKHVPQAGTRDPVTLEFPESLDEALLQRIIQVLDEKDAFVQGKVVVGKSETCWEFIPSMIWKPGNYRMAVETILEDLAGNSIARPFELDKDLSESSRQGPNVVYLGFAVQ